MAGNLGPHGFDATGIEPRAEFEHIPAGRYRAAITASNMVETKNGNGAYLSLEFTVLEGEYANRLVWARLNLDNPNAQAVEIAQRELSAVCHACGKLRIKDSSELHDIPIEINVKVKTDPEGRYEPSNEIRGYKALGSNGAAEPSQPWKQKAAEPVEEPPAAPSRTPRPTSQPRNAAPPPAGNGNGTVPPWKRR